MSKLSTKKIPLWYALLPAGILLLLFAGYVFTAFVLDARAHPPHKVTCTAYRDGDEVTVTYMGGLQQSWVEDLTIMAKPVVTAEQVPWEIPLQEQIHRPKVGASWTFQARGMVEVECLALDAATQFNWTIYKKIV